LLNIAVQKGTRGVHGWPHSNAAALPISRRDIFSQIFVPSFKKEARPPSQAKL
jgi:hypothetical protein